MNISYTVLRSISLRLKIVKIIIILGADEIWRNTKAYDAAIYILKPCS